MGIFKRNRAREEPQRAQTTRTAVVVGADEYGQLILTGYKPVANTEPFRRCAHKLCDMVSNMTIYLMANSDNGDVRVKNGLSRAIDIEPAPGITRKSFVYALTDDLISRGNALVLPHYSKSGLLVWQELLDAASASYSQIDSDGHYTVTVGGKRYQSDELLHFVLNPSRQPRRRHVGVGFVSQIRDVVETYSQATETKKSFMKSKYQPPLILSIDADSEELQDPEKRENILESYIGSTTKGTPWLIPAGELDVKEIRPLTLQDLAVQDSIKLDVGTIAAAVGVPGFLVGVGDFNPEAYNNFISTTVMSIARVIEQTYTQGLIWSDNMYFKFSPKSLLQYNLRDKTAYVQTMVNSAILNRNEGRGEFDWSPVDKPGMNEYAALENYIPVDKLGQQNKLGGDKNE